MLPNTKKLKIEKPKELDEKLDIKSGVLMYVVLAVVVLGAFYYFKK